MVIHVAFPLRDTFGRTRWTDNMKITVRTTEADHARRGHTQPKQSPHAHIFRTSNTISSVTLWRRHFSLCASTRHALLLATTAGSARKFLTKCLILGLHAFDRSVRSSSSIAVGRAPPDVNFRLPAGWMRRARFQFHPEFRAGMLSSLPPCGSSREEPQSFPRLTTTVGHQPRGTR